MDKIDWSKAPEGATGAMVANFIELSEGIYSGFVEFIGHEGADDREVYDEAADSWVFHERPMPWTGEGLPPVGIACEVENDIDGGWDAVDEVLAHTVIKGAEVAVFKRDDRVLYSLAHSFRPIRTPEQIAAEERERAALDMAQLMTGHADRAKDCYAILGGILYDAGYRKVDKP